MPPDDEPKGSPQDWLKHANSNLTLAKVPKPEAVLWEHLCFDAQQAAEKAVKAVLVFHSIEFPKTHMIAKLLALLDDAGHKVPDALWEVATVLTPYASEARYPGVPTPVDEQKYRQAVAAAEAALRWAGRIIGEKEGS